MAEYYFWEDNKIVRADGLIEIRKKFIHKWGKNKICDIFKKGHTGVAGHIYYATGTWIYKDYIRHKAYALKEDGRTEYELQHMFY